MPGKLDRRELVKAVTRASLAAATLAKPIAMRAAQNSNPASQAQRMGVNIIDQLYEYIRVDIKAALPKRV